MLRFEDGLINLQELIRRLAGDVANVVIAAEADLAEAARKMILASLELAEKVDAA